MTTLQSILYFAVTVPATLVFAALAADTGHYRHRVDISWIAFTVIAAWALAAVVLVWTVIS